MMVAAVAAATTAALVAPLVRPRARSAGAPERSGATDTAPGPIRVRRRRRGVGATPAVAIAGVAAIAVAVIAVVGIVPAVALGVAACSWPSLRRLLRARADRRRIDAALPDTIEMLILVVHAGMTPHQAIVLLGDRAPTPTRPALREVRRRISRGATLADALAALPELLGPVATSVADTLAMAERYGNPIGQALEQLALDVRERRRRTSEAEARTLPIRMAFPLVCCTLPSFVLVAIVPAVLAALASLDTNGF